VKPPPKPHFAAYQASQKSAPVPQRLAASASSHKIPIAPLPRRMSSVASGLAGGIPALNNPKSFAVISTGKFEPNLGTGGSKILGMRKSEGSEKMEVSRIGKGSGGSGGEMITM
jgi:hypothetical protein